MEKEFEIGEVLVCKDGKYSGRKIEVIDRHNNFHPTLYSCKVLSNGKEIALFQHEIETIFQHDMRQHAEWKKIQDGR